MTENNTVTKHDAHTRKTALVMSLLKSLILGSDTPEEAVQIYLMVGLGLKQAIKYNDSIPEDAEESQVAEGFDKSVTVDA